MQFNFNFGPGFINPEELQRQAEELAAQMRIMIEDKKCKMCVNANIVNEQFVFCNFSGKNVEESDGQNCEHWEAVQI